MQYFLIERQEGGCDYTIGCGIRITIIDASSKDEAIEKAIAEMLPFWKQGHEFVPDSGELLIVSESVNLNPLLDHCREEENQKELEEKRLAIEQAELKEFERLKAKFSKKA